MKVFSIEPFVPSGSNFEGSKQFFSELGFNISSDNGDYVGFEKDGCRFILQRYEDKPFAENYMLSVKIDDAAAFRVSVIEKKLPERFGIRVGQVTRQFYGKEVNIIDLAGDCWHFIEQ